MTKLTENEDGIFPRVRRLIELTPAIISFLRGIFTFSQLFKKKIAMYYDGNLN